jgi:hypothetical protein
VKVRQFNLIGPDGAPVTHFTPPTGVDAMVEKLDKLHRAPAMVRAMQS